jgi:hypothetical protein
MRLLDKLERIFGRFAIPNLSMFIVIGQVAVFLMAMLHRLDLSDLLYAPVLAVHQPWRFLTFILYPMDANWYFIAFTWYMFYLMGSALEEYWGDFRYNLFLLTGYALTIGLSFLAPGNVYDATFIGGAVFLAFAYINPNFEIMLLMLLPIKVRWLAVLTWFGYAFAFVKYGWDTRLSILAGVGNFLIFFAPDILANMNANRRQQRRTFKALSEASKEPEARHRCVVCGKTNLTDPQMDFRYCSQCEGPDCYCPDHIRNHEHTKAP